MSLTLSLPNNRHLRLWMPDMGDNEMDHRDCYGKMFPDVLHLHSDTPVPGKVFSVLLERAGGLIRCNRSITANQEEWDECLQCPEFDHCYKFCMAKLTLASAIITE